jgi:hypothetical protein
MNSKYFIAALAAAAIVGTGLAAPASAATPVQAAVAGCHVHWEGGANGHWFADYSDTMTTNTKRGQTGDRVREVQCLLTVFAGESGDRELLPGGVDGIFGANTEDAVVHAQKKFFPRSSSEWDGEVGSKTWPKLRRYTDYIS